MAIKQKSNKVVEFLKIPKILTRVNINITFSNFYSAFYMIL